MNMMKDMGNMENMGNMEQMMSQMMSGAGGANAMMGKKPQGMPGVRRKK